MHERFDVEQFVTLPPAERHHRELVTLLRHKLAARGVFDTRGGRLVFLIDGKRAIPVGGQAWHKFVITTTGLHPALPATKRALEALVVEAEATLRAAGVL